MQIAAVEAHDPASGLPLPKVSEVQLQAAMKINKSIRQKTGIAPLGFKLKPQCILAGTEMKNPLMGLQGLEKLTGHRRIELRSIAPTYHRLRIPSFVQETGTWCCGSLCGSSFLETCAVRCAATRRLLHTIQ